MRGIERIPQIEILRTLNSSAPSLTEFRLKVYLENGGRQEDWDKPLSRQEITSAYSHLSRSQREEIYKFNARKWSHSAFDGFEVAVDQQKIISISGYKKYRSWLRIAMHHYLLKEFRSSHRSLMFRRHGFLSKHLEFAKENKLSGVFFTIHKHNSRLASFSQFLRHIHDYSLGDNSHIDDRILQFKTLEYPVRFYAVEQEIHYLPVEETQREFPHNVLEEYADARA